MSGLIATLNREVRLRHLVALVGLCLAGSTGYAQGRIKKSPVAPAQAAVPEVLEVKAPQKIRIGVAPTEPQLGQGTNVQGDFGAPIRDAIVALMNGPVVEVVALTSRIPIQLQAESAEKHCAFILLSSVTVKHNSGGFGRLMKSAGMVSNAMPMVALTKMAANKAAAAAMTAQQQAASELAAFEGQIKSKDDVSLDYQLFPTGQGKAKLENSLKAKAKADKEDVLTPLIQEAANTILTEVTKK
jgi:hypothetical protein